MIPHYLPLPFWQDKNLKFLWHKDPSWCTTVYYMFGLIYLLLCSNSTLLSVPWTHSVLSCLYLQCYFHYMECSYLFFFFSSKKLCLKVPLFINSSLNFYLVMSLFPLFPIASYMYFNYNDHIVLHLLHFIQQIKFTYNMPGTFLNAGNRTKNKSRSLPTWNYCTI